MTRRLLILAFVATSLVAQAGRVQTPAEAIAADAREYARSQGVTQEEAVRRLNMQMEMGGLIGQLRKTYKSRLAGIAIEHQPVYRVRVLLTGTQPVASQKHKLAGSTLPVVFEVGAKATVDQMVQAMIAHSDALKRIYPTLAGMGTDERIGAIALDVYAPDAESAAIAKAKLPEAEKLLGVPVRIEIVRGYPSNDVGDLASPRPARREQTRQPRRGQ